MADRERLLTIIGGGSPDRIPWIPRLQIWYEAHRHRGTLPDKYQGWSLREIECDLGMGTPAREAKIFHTELRDVEVRTQQREDATVTEYVTPVGAVSTLHRLTKELKQIGIGGLEVEHLIKGPADYPVVEYLIQHTEIVPTFQEYLAFEQAVGEDGLPLVYIGQDPMNRILQELIGYNNAFYHLHDYKEQVLHLYEVLKEQAMQIQEVALNSPATLIMHGEHFDSMMTPPPIFREYMLPYFRPFAERLNERGKLLVGHADADTRLLLDLIKAAGFDLLECFVTSPMVSVTLEEARAVFGTDVIIWGGIPSVMLCDPVSDQVFEDYMLSLFRTIAPGDAFILGVADNVMPEAKFERIARVSELVEEYGEYPIQLG
jgi:hypothetical protein